MGGSCLPDEQNYLLRDAEAEVLFSFSLEESLKRAHAAPLFKVRLEGDRPRGVPVAQLEGTHPGRRGAVHVPGFLRHPEPRALLSFSAMHLGRQRAS